MENDFEILSHTADTGIIAYGDDLPELFVNAARGLFSIITALGDIAATIEQRVEVNATDREALLVNWLNELIYLTDARQMLFSRFEVVDLSDQKIIARAFGENIDIEKHTIKIQVKAATYHQLKIENTADGWRARVIFDV